MLFRIATLKRIKSGDITLAFRRWRKPTVKTGGTLNTAIGQLAIVDLSRCSIAQINHAEAVKAGFASKTDLQKELQNRDGEVYRIEIRYAGVDPREALRTDGNLDREELRGITDRLARLDRSSKTGPWTLRLLQAVARYPRLRAADLAVKTGDEKDWLKPNVRKLKNLGLTVSLETGFELSLRGRVVLGFLEHPD